MLTKLKILAFHYFWDYIPKRINNHENIIMKTRTRLTALAATLPLSTFLIACGGGTSTTTSTGVPGTIKSTAISSGTITGFGSVYVNGVKFDTNSSSFDIEGIEGSQDDLAIGMVVKVNGTINPDGVTGTATRIIFDDDLQGPVTNYVINQNGQTASFTVLGTNVEIDSKTTHFDDDNGSISLNSIRNGDIVELSGFFDANGTLIASRIEGKNGTDSNIEVKGNITNLVVATSNFTINGIQIDASGARFEDLPNGLREGAYVEVKGSYDGTRIIAIEVESEEYEYDDNDEFEVEGFITNYNGNSSFIVNGITVDISKNPRMEPRNLQLANNLQIEVEGRLVNGVLIASELKMRGGEIEVSAPITSVDIANNRFEVEPVNGQRIVILTGTGTQFENDLSNSYSVRISDLRIGQFVEVEGYQNSDGSITAHEVEITRPEEVEVQGVIESFQANTITILGINFELASFTRFDSDGSSIRSIDALRSRVNSGERILVEVELINNTNTISKIEIED